MTERYDTTGRDQEVLTIIRRSIREREFPPSIGEIASELDMHKESAARALRRLVRDGHIEVTPGTARGIRVKRATMTTNTEDF